MGFGCLIPLATFNNQVILKISCGFQCFSHGMNLRLVGLFVQEEYVLISDIGSQAVRHRDGTLLDYTGGKVQVYFPSCTMILFLPLCLD